MSGLVFWAGALPLVRHFYSDQGEFPIAAARVWSREFFARYLMFDFLGSYPAAVLVFVLWGAVLAALLLGWKTRLAAWASFLLYMWVYYRNTTFGNGGDEMLRLASFYLALGYSVVPVQHRSFTLDRLRWIRGGGTDNVTAVPAWPVRMFQIQICAVYLVAGFWKVVDPLWWSGVAAIYALGNESFTRFGAPGWAGGRPLYLAATILIAWWEFLFTPLVAWGRTRSAVLICGVALHLGILALMSIGIFPLIMLACYPAFLSGEQVGRLVRTLRGGWIASVQPSSEDSSSTASRVSPNVSA
jgi:hypothetical protein